jgi:hypothetical protein
LPKCFGLLGLWLRGTFHSYNQTSATQKGKGSSWPLEWYQLEVFTYEPVRTQAAAGGIQAAFRSARSRLTLLHYRCSSSSHNPYSCTHSSIASNCTNRGTEASAS